MPSSNSSEKDYDTIQCTLNTYHPCPVLLSQKDEYFYIKRIEFFASAADAELARGGTVIDLSSRVAAERTLSFDTENTDSKFVKHNAEGLFGMSEFDDNEHALSLKYSDSSGERADCGSRIKFSLRMKNSYVIKEKHSYMVVTYKTNITSQPEKIRLMLGNYWDQCLVLEEDISVSAGRYVRTKPINIHTLEQPRQDFFDRLRHSYTPGTHYTGADLIYITSQNSSGVQVHPYFEILYNIDGIADAVVHSTACRIRQGDIIIVPPLCAHDVISKDTPSTLYSIKFRPEYLYAYGMPSPIMRSHLNAWQELIRSSPLITADVARKSGLDKLIEELIGLTEHLSFQNHVKIHSKLLAAFSIMLEYYEDGTSDVGNSAVSTSSFARAIEEAQKNMYNFSTADAAKISNLSYNYFCSGFKKAYGMPFSAYLDSLRLSESTHLLLTSDMSITDIAASVGFSDTSHYIRKFKRAYNITPHKYRIRASKRS